MDICGRIRLSCATGCCALLLLFWQRPPRRRTKHVRRFSKAACRSRTTCRGHPTVSTSRADANQALDYPRLGERLETTATLSRRVGDSHAHQGQEDLIEFQIGTVAASAPSPTTRARPTPLRREESRKGARERIDDETEPRRKRSSGPSSTNCAISRAREPPIDVERERLDEIKKRRIAEERLKGGSRFNLRVTDEVPPGFGPKRSWRRSPTMSTFRRHSRTLPDTASRVAPPPAAGRELFHAKA